MYGQADSLDIKIIIQSEQSYTQKPALVLVLDTYRIHLDTMSLKLIQPNWIKRLEVIKSEKLKTVHGNTDGVVFIYPKRRYRKRILSNLNIKY